MLGLVLFEFDFNYKYNLCGDKNESAINISWRSLFTGLKI
jgi:hypothetical protein